MVTDDSSFRFDYRAGTIRYGPDCVSLLADELDRRGLERALVVCGRTVGETPAVVEPVKAGLGDRLAGVFARTTPEKSLETAYEGAAAMREADADALVSLGGGSSLDTAKVASVLAATDRPRDEVAAELRDDGKISVPSGSIPPVVAVPTTLAGADLSSVAGVTLPAGFSAGVEEPASGGVSDRRLMPTALFYDPDLFATTPDRVLAASAMNGFDKGVEALYAETATPVTDATATRGLRLLREGLPALGRGERGAETMERVVTGIVLVQYGVSRPTESTLSLVHAFGHGLSRNYDVHQGVAHAVVAPHALRYLFDRVDGRRGLLAEALGRGDAASDPEDAAAAVVAAVAEIRDALGLPSQLRTVEGPTREDLSAVAEAVLDDSLMENAPAGLDPTVEELAGVLRDAW